MNPYRLFFSFLLLLKLPILISAQTAEMRIGVSRIPFRMDQTVEVTRVVYDSIIKDKRHKLAKFNLGRSSSTFSININDVQHLKREIFDEKMYIWSRLTDDTRLRDTQMLVTMLADSPFVYKTPMILRCDTVTGINPTTLKEQVRVVNYDEIQINYYLSNITKLKLIDAIEQSFGLPEQNNIRPRVVSVSYFSDSIHLATVTVDYRVKASVEEVKRIILDLKKGAELILTDINFENTNGRQFNAQLRIAALIKLID